MKKSILSLTLLLVFSTNINANKIIYEKSQSTKELEAISNWYFNEYLVNQKVQEKLINDQLGYKPENKFNNNVKNKYENIKSNSNVNNQSNNNVNNNSNNNVNKNNIERYKLANDLIYKKEIGKAKGIFNELCNDKFELACRKLKKL